MGTIANLRAQADTRLFDGAHAEALSLYVRLVELQPESLDTRLRAGDPADVGSRGPATEVHGHYLPRV